MTASVVKYQLTAMCHP